MATILYLSPGVGSTPERKAVLEAFANSCLTNSANRVFLAGVDEGPVSIESSIEGELSVKGMLKKAIQLKGQYDAVIIGCTDDPGIFSLRELLDVPVVGPFETSFAMASVLGDSYGVITTTDSTLPETRMILRKYGVYDHCRSLRAVNFTVAELNHKDAKESIVKAFVREARLAVADGAATIVLGCMSLAMLRVDELVKNEIPAPVINPIKVSVKMAEMLVSLGLKQSVLSYPHPDMQKLANTLLPELKSD